MFGIDIPTLKKARQYTDRKTTGWREWSRVTTLTTAYGLKFTDLPPEAIAFRVYGFRWVRNTASGNAWGVQLTFNDDHDANYATLISGTSGSPELSTHISFYGNAGFDSGWEGEGTLNGNGNWEMLISTSGSDLDRVVTVNIVSYIGLRNPRGYHYVASWLSRDNPLHTIQIQPTHGFISGSITILEVLM